MHIVGDGIEKTLPCLFVVHLPRMYRNTIITIVPIITVIAINTFHFVAFRNALVPRMLMLLKEMGTQCQSSKLKNNVNFIS